MYYRRAAVNWGSKLVRSGVSVCMGVHSNMQIKCMKPGPVFLLLLLLLSFTASDLASHDEGSRPDFPETSHHWGGVWGCLYAAEVHTKGTPRLPHPQG